MELASRRAFAEGLDQQKAEIDNHSSCSAGYLMEPRPDSDLLWPLVTLDPLCFSTSGVSAEWAPPVWILINLET